MLPKTKRIPKSLFLYQKQSKSVSSPLCMVRFYTESKDQRFSCIISKKIAKTAVARNLLKRRVFSIIDTLELPKYYFFIYPSKEAINTSFKELKADLAALCAKIR